MNTLEVSALLFARDHANVAAFYRDALGLNRTSGDADHTVFNCGGFEFVVHQIPARHLGGGNPEGAPKRRENGAIRMNFTVDDTAASRRRAAELGGHIDDAPPSWAGKDANIFLGHDPDGNVFAVRERAR